MKHRIVIFLNKKDFQKILVWLRNQGHELHVTMRFGKNHSYNDTVAQEIYFTDPNDAMICKLAWGGK